MKNLVIQTAFLGDLLLSIPLLKNIKLKYPEDELVLVCRKGLSDVIKKLNLCSEIIEIDKKNWSDFKQKLKRLKSDKFENIFCPHESPRSAWMVWQIDSKNKIGFSSWWNFFIFNKRVFRNLKLPDALRQLSLLNPDIQRVHNSITSMGLRDLILNHSEKDLVLKKFNQINKGCIFLAPGSVWNTKRWTEHGYREVAQNLSKKHQIVLIGSKEEKSLCDQISSEIPNSLNLAGETSLFELLVILTEGLFLVCNDSGAMHMASIAELPTVAIFGPTVLSQGYEPWQSKAIVVENKNLGCRPCGRHGHAKCPIGTHECMVSITSKEVLDTALKLN